MADANLTLTGIALTSSLGDETAVPGVEVPVTGQALAGSVGTVDVDDVTVGLTGIALTSSITSVRVSAWSPVVPGVSNTWTEVTPGVTNTWTEVDIAA